MLKESIATSSLRQLIVGFCCATWACSVCSIVVGQSLFINEVMTSNDVAHPDEFFEFDDWIEIFNAGGLLQLAGYHLSDDSNDLTKYTFPSTDLATTYLPPNSHTLVWLDQDSVQGVLHANFKLSSENEGIWLTAPDGVTVLDSLVYPPQQTDISYGRACDGCQDWTFFNVPTPESENQQTDLPTPELYINEVLLENSGVLLDESFEPDAWLEVYNPNNFQVNLGGYSLLTSSGASYVIPSTAPVETTVAANGFLLFWLDGEPEEGAHHLGLNPLAEVQTFSLVGPDMVVADEYEAQVSFPNVSWGRLIDGAPNSGYFDIPTPRVTNALLVVPADPVVLNECQSLNVSGVYDNANELEDWVEIHNRSSNSVNLAGYYLSDKLNNPQKWRIPLDAGDSTVIAPNGYILIWADGDEEQGWNHTNFKLNSNGESLVLRSPDGFTIADSVHFGTTSPDESFARIPNGIGPFTWVQEPTPIECNDCTEHVSQESSRMNAWYKGGNPIRAGARFDLDVACSLLTLDGSKVISLEKGIQDFPNCVPGVYVLKNVRGSSLVLVVQ